MQIMLGCLYSRGSNWPLWEMNLTLVEDAMVILMPGPAALRPTNAGKERETVILTVIAKPAYNVGRTIAESTILELQWLQQIAAIRAASVTPTPGPVALMTSPVDWGEGTATMTANAARD